MRVRTDKGVTEIKFADLVTVKPEIVKVREAFRDGKASKEKVEEWSSKHFGISVFLRELDAVTKDTTGVNELVRSWDAWIADQPLIHRKLFYDPSVIAGCIMGKDE